MTIIQEKRLKNGFSMPTFGLGTWGMGGRYTKETKNDSEDIAAIERAIDAGITHIDTAELYGNGHAETLVGEALKGQNRSHIFLVSKVLKDHLSFDDVLRAAEGSLNRLGTNYLDLYLVHSFNPEIPLSETMRAMNHLVEEGLVRNIGVSNFTIENMEEAQNTSEQMIVANQLQYNLHYRKREKEGLLRHAQEHDWMFIAWRPILDVLQMEETPEILQSLCKKYEKTPAQIAINWLISQKNVITLAKCGSKKHLDEALDAINWSMEEEDIELLRTDFTQEDVDDLH